MQRYLPEYGDGFESWRLHRASTTQDANPHDNFLYRGREIDPWWDFDRLVRATPLMTQPLERGGAVYDPIHGEVLYAGWCCSFHHTVLASVDAAPPSRIATTDLSRVTTLRGVALGQTIGQVRARYGAARAYTVWHHRNLLRLAYAQVMPKAHGCGAFQDFVFRDGRLVYAEILEGC